MAFGVIPTRIRIFHICREHSRVVPAESHAAKHRSEGSEDERLRTIALLQQKAASLEGEIAERQRMEAELRRCNAELTSFCEEVTG